MRASASRAAATSSHVSSTYRTTSGIAKPSPTSGRPPKVSETASPRSFIPSSRPHRQSLIPMTRRSPHCVRSTMALEPVGRVVVVADQQRLAARPGALRAADDEARRAVEREQARREVTAAGKLDDLLVDGHQLGHVLLERPPAGRVAGARGVALLEVPRLVGRPHGLEPLAPGRARPELLDGLELELAGRRMPLREQPELIPQRLPIAVDRGHRLRRQPPRPIGPTH